MIVVFQMKYPFSMEETPRFKMGTAVWVVKNYMCVGGGGREDPLWGIEYYFWGIKQDFLVNDIKTF